MKKQIYLFYGEDIWSMQAKLKAWKDKFALKADVLFDSQELDGATVQWNDIVHTLSLNPLFATKRLVIIKNLLREGKKAVQDTFLDFLPKIPDSTVLVLVEEGTVDGRLKLFKTLASDATVQHFESPTPLTMRKLLREQLKDHAGIEPHAEMMVLERVGTDSMLLHNELKKLMLYADDTKITTSMVQELVAELPQSRIFTLVDAIFAGKTAEATKLMLKELHFGTAPLQINGLLISQARKLLIIKDGAEKNVAESELRKAVAVPPFVYSKMQNLVRKTEFTALLRYFTRLVRADIALKHGEDPESVMLQLSKF